MIPDETLFVLECVCRVTGAARRDQIATREDGVDASGVVGDCASVRGRARRARGAQHVACRAEDDVERSNYKDTSSAVKNLVSGLTALVNAFGESGGAERDGMTRKERREARPLPTTPRDPNALVRDISREFTEAKYLWTGDITPEMYDLFCTFTDPTLSFVGLETFERNLKIFSPSCVDSCATRTWSCTRASWRVRTSQVGVAGTDECARRGE